MLNLNRCNGSCDSLDDTSGRICISNKPEYVNLNVLNTITRINESRTLKIYVSCKCKCKFDGRKCNSNLNWNDYKCRCECKNPGQHHMCEKI